MTNTFKITALRGTSGDLFQASIMVDDETFAALPKSLGFKTKRYGLTIDLRPNKVNGGKNEGGIKRIRAILKHLPDAVWDTYYTNAYATLEEFKQVHGI